MESQHLTQYSRKLLENVEKLIVNTRNRVAINLNVETTSLYWSIGNYINEELHHQAYAQYGNKILVTLSQELTQKFGKGYSYSAITRMIKVASIYTKENIATLSQQLSWSHFIELTGIENPTKRLFYQQLCITENWSVRTLRGKTDGMLFERIAIAKQPKEIIQQSLEEATKNLSPDLVFKSTYILDFLNLSHNFSEKDLEIAIINQLEEFILELGSGFAFIERQKRMSIDTVDYYLDLLFYHRKLNRLIAIDLKLGKFKPEYKAKMELYLRYLQKYEQQDHENTPIGLLLCSEGNTEHVELLMLDEQNIRVAQYLTELPDKRWFVDKLHKAIAIAQENQNVK